MQTLKRRFVRFLWSVVLHVGSRVCFQSNQKTRSGLHIKEKNRRHLFFYFFFFLSGVAAAR